MAHSLRVFMREKWRPAIRIIRVVGEELGMDLGSEVLMNVEYDKLYVM